MLKKFIPLLVVAGSLFAPEANYAQAPIRNFGFEQFDAFRRLVSWNVQNTENQYGFRLEKADAKEGEYCLAIMLDPARKSTLGDKKGAGLINTGVIKHDFEGHDSIRVSAYIKTRDLEGGIASLWMETKGTDRILAGVNSDEKSAVGDSDWTKFTISLPIDPETQHIAFGCKMTGYGMAFFDDFEVFLDDEQLK